MSTEDIERRFAEHRTKLAIYNAQLPVIRAEGEAALRRLFKVAQSDTGQSRRIARFLLGLYNGDRFPFDLSDFRVLDLELFQDCISVLKMDKSLEREVHQYFEDGGRRFEQMAASWGWCTEDASTAASG